MTALSAPADGALGPLAADLLDSDVWFPLVVVLLFLAFAIGHLTGRIEARVRRTEDARPQGIAERPRREMTDSESAEWSERTQSAHRYAEYARFDVEKTAQLFPAGRTPVPSDEEFAEWSKRLDDALRDVQARTRVLPRISDKRVVCGRPAATNLGGVRCLADPGHPGQC